VKQASPANLDHGIYDHVTPTATPGQPNWPRGACLPLLHQAPLGEGSLVPAGPPSLPVRRQMLPGPLAMLPPPTKTRPGRMTSQCRPLRRILESRCHRPLLLRHQKKKTDTTISVTIRWPALVLLLLLLLLLFFN
jgi:hypothetical protein